MLITALIGAVPALLTILRRQRGAVEADGAATREALTSLGAHLNSRIDDVRTDLSGVRDDVTDVRAWQAAHTAEHLLIERHQRGDTP